jgi:ketol-acid reductoisomerase
MASKGEIIVHRDEDIRIEPITKRRVSIIGYGNQGRAHAFNLRDSGVDVLIGLRLESRSRDVAASEGFEIVGVEEAVRGGDVVALLIPDEAIPKVFAEKVGPVMKDGAQLLFAQGAAISFGVVSVDDRYDVILVAPMGPGKLLRELYVKGDGLNAKTAVYSDVTGEAWNVALAYAKALGCGRLGVIKTTFEAEAVLDFFSEQAVLCGGIPALAEAAFDTLVEAGYPRELAYVECVREIKYIADLLFESGMSGMRERISYTALYGGGTRGRRIIDGKVKKKLSKILEEIESGKFYRELEDCKYSRTDLITELENEEIELARTEYEALCSRRD